MERGDRRLRLVLAQVISGQRGVDDDDGAEDSAVAIRRIKPDSTWPPAAIPADERTYEEASQGGYYSRNIFQLKHGVRKTTYAALSPKLFTPDDKCPYKGIWTGT